MTTQGQTVVRIQKMNGIFTRVKSLQVYALNYLAGDARPDISLDTVNENYLSAANIQENGVYLCTWEQVGTRENPNTGEQLPRFAMRFTQVDQTNPLQFALQLKEFEKVFGNQKSVEEARKAKFRKNSDTNVNVNRHVESTTPVTTVDGVDDDEF